jgi:hypothetical protein
MRELTIAAFCLALAGCAPSTDQQSQQQFDNDKCRSYGAEPGEPAYIQCRSQLDGARTVAEATAAAKSRQIPE